MNQPRRPAIVVPPYQSASPTQAAGDRPLVAPRPGLGTRLLGWTLLGASVGLVSCQSLFSL